MAPLCQRRGHANDTDVPAPYSGIVPNRLLPSTDRISSCRRSVENHSGLASIQTLSGKSLGQRDRYRASTNLESDANELFAELSGGVTVAGGSKLLLAKYPRTNPTSTPIATRAPTPNSSPQFRAFNLTGLPPRPKEARFHRTQSIPLAASQRSASIAAWQPMPAAVTAWR